MLITCPECSKEISEEARFCPECGRPMGDEEMVGATEDQEGQLPVGEVVQAAPKGTPLTFWIWLAPLIGVAVWFFGAYHVVQSSAHPTAFVEKVHWTLAETFVSMDEITGMPYFAAQMKYPLAVKALQRDGLLESDDQRQRRIEADAKAATEKAMREAEANLRKEHPELFR